MSLTNTNKTIILASRSPRRAALLREAGVAFDVVPPKYQEREITSWQFSPAAYAESASYFKARSVAEDHPHRIVLGADTVVALGNRLFGKPTDRAGARRILLALSGTQHQVITGVALYEHVSGQRLIRHAVSHVAMKPLSTEELEAYLAGEQWMGKAGAYGIQDQNDPFVHIVSGSFSNVVGLPVELVLTMANEFDAMR